MRRIDHVVRGCVNWLVRGCVNCTWSEKALSAGMGMMDADRKARMFVTDVRNTDTPVLFKHSAVWSLKNKRWRHWWPAQVSGQGMRPTYTSKWHVRTADLMRSGFFFFKRNVLCFLTRYREALRWNLCACWPNSLRRCAPLKRYRPLPDPAPRKEWSERRIDIPLCAFNAL